MKEIRYIGVLLLSLVLCLGFVSCSSDDDDPAPETSSLVGSEWRGLNGNDFMVVVKITTASKCTVTVYYPNSTRIYNNKVCSYVYDADTGHFILNYSDDLVYEDYAMQGNIKGSVLTVTDKYSTYTLKRQ